MSTLRFLLLEDKPLDANAIQAMLTDGEIDYELLRVSTGADFVTVLESQVFDLILAEYALPDFGGIAALEIACNLCPNVPFIFVSASLGEKLVIEALKRGATDYVLKQRLERLGPCVQRALQEAKERRDRQRAEQMLVEQNRLLELIALGKSLHECLAAVCTSISQLNPHTRACFLLTDAQRLTFKSLITPNTPPSFGKGLKDAPTNELAIGTCGTAVYCEEPVTCADIANDQRWSQEWRDLCVAHGVLACHSTPVRGSDSLPLGSLMLCFNEARLPTDWERQLANFGAQVASIVFERDSSNLALRKSEAKYRTLFESIDEGFCICEMLFDENGEPTDYRFLEVNSIFASLTGLEQATGKTMRELAPNHEADWFEIYGRVVQTGEPMRFEQQAITLNCWFDVNAFCIGEPQSNQFAVLFTNITERKQIEQERDRFLAVGSDLQVITGINGYFQWVSPTFERSLGWTVDEMTSRPWTDFVHPDDIPESISETEGLFSGNETFAFENRYRHKDGSYRWFLWNAQPYPKEQVIYGAAVDISDRKQAEATLRESEAQGRNILESITDAFFAVDDNWLFTYVNQTAEVLVDRTSGDLIGKSFWEEFPGVNGSEFERMHRRVMRDRVAESAIAFYPDHDRWYEVRTYPAAKGVTMYFSNVTDRIQSEAALRQTSAELERQLQKFNAVISSVPDFIYIFDLSGRFLDVNKPLLDLWQKTLDEAIGKNFFELDYPEDLAAKLHNQVQEVIKTRQPLRDETPYTSPFGTRAYEYIFVPIFDAEGAVEMVAGITRDITERKQAEAQREQLLQQEQAAREAAELANRLKDEFLAVLSHELRSPLNPILGWTQLLQKGKLDAVRQAEALKTIERNAKLQSQLIEDLLDISRIMQGKLTLTVAPTSLSFVISAAVETVRLGAEAKHIQITLDLDKAIAPIFGDAARLQQVVWNLLTNAVKFTPYGGQVTVELRQLDRLAQIRVIDTGIGINPQFLPHVFEYFRQEDGSTTRKFGGLGLGLAIARQIVEMHEGIVKAESRGENQGAIFTVQLPAIQHAAPISSELTPGGSEIAAPLDKIQVLLVDDDTDTRKFQTFLLEQRGAKVTEVASGVEALQVLDRFIPDVLVSDVGMAEMDGYMLIKEIRARSPHHGGTIPAIALTAYAAELDRQRAIQAGFQEYITKPVEPEILVKTIVNLFLRN